MMQIRFKFPSIVFLGGAVLAFFLVSSVFAIGPGSFGGKIKETTNCPGGLIIKVEGENYYVPFGLPIGPLAAGNNVLGFASGANIPCPRLKNLILYGNLVVVLGVGDDNQTGGISSFGATSEGLAMISNTTSSNMNASATSSTYTLNLNYFLTGTTTPTSGAGTSTVVITTTTTLESILNSIATSTPTSTPAIVQSPPAPISFFAPYNSPPSYSYSAPSPPSQTYQTPTNAGNSSNANQSSSTVITTTRKGVLPQGFTFTRTLKQGSSGNDVKELQKVLRLIPEVYPEGLVTGYFGSLTRRAVERFQEKYLIAKKGEPGSGQVGPKTRKKLNEVFGG